MKKEIIAADVFMADREGNLTRIGHRRIALESRTKGRLILSGIPVELKKGEWIYQAK